MNGIRPLNETEAHALGLGRLVAYETAPYFVRAVLAMAPVAAPGLGTFAVDRHWRLYVDPALLVGAQAWTPATVAAVLQHECGHLLREHANRYDALPGEHDHTIWNFSADAEVNDDLLDAGVPLPEGVVTPEGLGLPPHDLAETYYAALMDRDDEQRRAWDDDAPGCGSGAGGPGIPGELPAQDTGTAPGRSDAEADLVRRLVARDVLDHAEAKGRGSVPASVQRWAERQLAPATVPWERVLRACVRRAVAHRVGQHDYTYARPSRRPVAGVIRPAMRQPVVRVAIVVDTSGSMSRADLDAAMGEIEGVLRAGGVDRDAVTVLACDAVADRPQRVRSAREVSLIGGGGTDMRVGITAAEAARPAPHVVIVLSDGYTPWPEHRSRSALICALIGTDPPTSGTPPWAQTVVIPPAA